MGIAIDRTSSTASTTHQPLPPQPPHAKDSITIRDLLNMRSGLDADDEDPSTPGDEDNLDNSTDWIKSVYAVP